MKKHKKHDLKYVMNKIIDMIDQNVCIDFKSRFKNFENLTWKTIRLECFFDEYCCFDRMTHLLLIDFHIDNFKEIEIKELVKDEKKLKDSAKFILNRLK